MRFIDSAPTDTILVGQGFNTISASHGGQTVEYSDSTDLVKVDENADGMQLLTDVRQITSLTQLKERMNVSATASAGFGIYSGDASSSYIRGRTFNEYSVSIFIDVCVLEPARVLKSSRMTADALEAASNGLARFLSYCGNAYCYGNRRGGRFTAIADFSATTLKEHEKISAEASAIAGGYASGNAEFERTIERLSAVSNFSLKILRSGPKDAVPTLAEVAGYARTFPERVAKDGSYVVGALLRSYETTPNFPFKEINIPRLNNLARIMELICGDLDSLYKAQGDLNFLQSRTGWYEKGVALKDEIKSAWEHNESEIKRLLEAARLISEVQLEEAPSPADIKIVDPGEAAKPKPPPIIVELYEHIDYAGRKVALNESHPNLHSIGFGDALSSFKLLGAKAEYKVEFYSDPNYSGKRIEFISPTSFPDIRKKWPMGNGVDVFGGFDTLPNWNDQVSSVRITKLK